MAFPDISPESVQRTVVPFHRAEKAADGVPQFFEPHPFMQQVWTVAWSILTQTERDDIGAHYASYRSSFFNFFDSLLRKITNRLVGTGNGIATVFTLPSKETGAAGLVVRVAGVVTAVTLSAGTGPEGEDQITFALAPANGAEIRYDATEARARVEVFYDPEQTTVSDGHLEAGLYTVGGVVLAERIAA